jgi:hypothetical protein
VNDRSPALERLRQHMQAETTYEESMRRFLRRRPRKLKRGGAYPSPDELYAR